MPREADEAALVELLDQMEKRNSQLKDEYSALLIESENMRTDLAALKPWAEVGKRAIRNGWWKDTGYNSTSCMACEGWRHPDGWKHDAYCLIPALLAQLEAEDAAA